MKFHYTMSGAQTFLKKYPLYSATTAIPVGAVVMKGATPGTNQGFGIIGAPAYPGVLGVTEVADTNVVAGGDSKQDGSAFTRYKLCINADAVYLCELTDPTTANIAVASSSTVTVTITSLEDDIDGGWLWGSDGQLQWIATSAAGSCTTKTATGWTSAIKVSRLLPLFKILTDLNTAATKLLPAAAIGTGKIIIVENYVQQKPNARIETLDPTKHSGITMDNTFAKLFSDIMFQNHALTAIGAS